MGSREERTVRPGRKALVWGLLFGNLFLVGFGGVALRPKLMVLLYEHRIRRGIAPEANLRLLARQPGWASAPVLEEMVRRTPPEIRRSLVARLLLEHGEHSILGRGMIEYAAITREDYLAGNPWWNLDYDDRSQIPASQAAELQVWLATYPDHPGRDDACLRTGIALCDSDPLASLRILCKGHDEPDGERRESCANWFQCVLERCARVEHLERWLAEDCPTTIRANVTYVLALKLLRERRYAESVRRFEEWAALPANGESRLAFGTELSGVRPWPLAERNRLIPAQRELAIWLDARTRAAASAGTPEERASCLHALGRRLFRAQELLDNYFYYRYSGRWLLELRTNKPAGEEDPPDFNLLCAFNPFRQAAEVFHAIENDFPGYSAIDEVAYSVPLAFWRALQRVDSHGSGERINLEIARDFRRFASRYPGSRLADDALYCAAVRQFAATGWKDRDRLRRDLAQVLERYPGGDAASLFGSGDRALQEVMVARKFGAPPVVTAARVPPVPPVPEPEEAFDVPPD